MRRRPSFVSGRRRTLAVAVAVSATVVTPLAVHGASSLTEDGSGVTSTAGETSTASKTGEQEKPLSAAPAARGVTADVAGGGSAVKEVSSDSPFSMVGITWKGSHPDAKAHVRARQADGAWGPWYEAESVDSDRKPAPNGRGGTEPVYLGTETTAVQVTVTGVAIEDTSVGGSPEAAAPRGDAQSSGAQPSGAQQAPAGPAPATQAPASQAPAAQSAPANGDVAARHESAPPAPTAYADIKPVADSSPLPAGGDGVSAVLLSPDATPTPAADTGDGSYGDVSAKGGTGAKGNIAAKQPGIISRAGWGADESINCMDPEYDDSLAAAVVHHTAGSNYYSKAQSASVVRGIYTYHAVNLGWCDVGYNVLVDKYGQAFEGRAGGLTKNVQGAHAGGFNANTFGISMMGDYSTAAPPQATIQKVGEVIGWRLALAGVDPKGKDTHYSEGTSYTKYPAGTSVTLPNIFAHRDVGLTTCPGDAGYSRMNAIRDIAAAYAKGGNSGGNPGGGNSGGNPGGGTPSTPSTPGGGASTTLPRDPASIQKLVADALKSALTGGKVDLGSLSSLVGKGGALKDIPVDPGSVQDLAKGGDLTKLFNQLAGAAGPLGKMLSGVQRYGNVSLVKTENGAIYQSDATGAHAVWGAIGDAWAAQGFEHGPLGLPVAEEQKRADGKTEQRFQNGVLVFDPATGTVSAESAR